MQNTIFWQTPDANCKARASAVKSQRVENRRLRTTFVIGVDDGQVPLEQVLAAVVFVLALALVHHGGAHTGAAQRLHNT